MFPMKADLQELMITDGECNHITGEKVKLFKLEFSGFNEEGINKFEQMSAEEQKLKTPKFWMIIGIIIISIVTLYLSAFSILLVIRYFFRRWRFKNLVELLKEVNNHNQIIENLHTLDQLQEVGNPVKINDRGTVIEALRITREGLVRALKTERILRENPRFKPEYFNIDLSTLEAEKTTVKAIEYAQLLDDAVQIGVSVQKEMRKLQSKR
jgi:uncharacterized protein YpiB (UPF0302 family)